MTQAIRVIVQILQRHRLGADVTTAEGVSLVPANRLNVIPAVLYLDTAHGFAQIAGVIVQVLHPWPRCVVQRVPVYQIRDKKARKMCGFTAHKGLSGVIACSISLAQHLKALL